MSTVMMSRGRETRMATTTLIVKTTKKASAGSRKGAAWAGGEQEERGLGVEAGREDALHADALEPEPVDVEAAQTTDDDQGDEDDQGEDGQLRLTGHAPALAWWLDPPGLVHCDCPPFRCRARRDRRAGQHRS